MALVDEDGGWDLGSIGVFMKVGFGCKRGDLGEADLSLLIYTGFASLRFT